MPFENTSRWPRLVSCFGMKLSPAWKLASRGKSAKLVLAARTRMSIVPACSDVEQDVADGPRAEDELADLGDDGRRAARERRARASSRPATDRPRNMTPSSVPMIDERAAGVLPLRLAERGHAVGDRLDAGDRRATRREGRAGSTNSAAPMNSPVPGVPTCTRPWPVVVGDGAGSPIAILHEPDAEQHDHVADEEVGRDGEHACPTPSRPAGCRTR